MHHHFFAVYIIKIDFLFINSTYTQVFGLEFSFSSV